MPRKKLVSTDVPTETPTAAQTPTAEEPKKRTRTRKNPEASSATPTEVMEILSEAPPVTPTEPPALSEAAPKRTVRPSKKAAVVEEPAVVEKPAAKPAKKKADTKSAKASAPKVAEPKPDPTPAPKPARGRTTSKSEKVVKVAEPDYDGDMIAPMFRARQQAATPAPREKAPPAGDLISSDRPRRERQPRRGRKEETVGLQAPQDAAPLAQSDAFLNLDDDLPMPIWRTRSGPAPKRSQVEADEEGMESGEDAGRRPRRRRRRGEKDVESGPVATAEVATATESSAPPSDDSEIGVPSVQFRGRGGRKKEEPREEKVAAKPVEVPRPKERRQLLPPPKPLIPIPDDAPQVVLRDGIPTLVRNHRVYPPIMFFGNTPDERRTQTVLEETRMAAECGVHLHSVMVEFDVDPAAVDTNASMAAYMLSQILKIDPDAQVVFRVVFQAPRGWEREYPEALYRNEDGTNAEPSVCDDKFWGVAKDCLQTFIKKLRLLDRRDSILGIHLERGEWFMAQGWGYDDSRAAQIKFREWARVRYLDDEVALRANWFDGQVRLDSIAIPPYQPEGSDGDRFVRSSRKQRRYVDYHLFLSDATVQRIGDLAYAAKETSEGYFLIGVSYGYTFEWSHPSSGHLSLGKLLRTPEIDFIAGPPSYRTREPGGTAPFPGPIDSFALNGKLFISEEDFKTSLSGGHEPDDFNPVIKTPQALESVHWRGAGAALAHGSGVSWMDLWGTGWLKTASIWDRAATIQKALTSRMGTELSDPDVVVFIDERALAYLVDPNAFNLLVQNARESVLRAGVNAGFYLLSDLAHRETFPEAKLYIFLNAWDIRNDLRAAIKTRLQRDGKVLFWLYSAGLFDAGRESLERAREVTGIALKPQPFYSKSGTTILNRRHPLCEAFPDRSLVGGTQLEPSYFAIPEDATVLGEYTQTGLPSFIVKEFRAEGKSEVDWTSVFLGEPLVNPALIRALSQMAGAHVYNFNEDVVHVRPPFLTVHCSGAGPRTVTLPNKWAAYNLLAGQWVTTEATNLRFTATDGSTHVFLVGEREDLEHLLTVRPEDLLRMAQLPPKPDNTMRQDGIGFDVPIMKLDTWMEGGEPDEVADEWFLRPPAIIETPEPEGDEDKVGRRRRRRRGGRSGDRTGSEEIVTARREPSGGGDSDDFGMSVVFRKRE